MDDAEEVVDTRRVVLEKNWTSDPREYVVLCFSWGFFFVNLCLCLG